ncbi:MAG: hypothetical protein Q8Q44_02030, partial [Nocardioides sp.]|nr:hypothetical protein [Nocardioides sp.]
MTDPLVEFRKVAAAHDRCFWLDGGGAREWSGRRSLIGWLEEDDVSLTYDAATGEVCRHSGGRSVVVGSDIFDALAAELAAGGADDQWFGYFGYGSRPDLPASIDPDDPMPTALWMRPSHVRLFDHQERTTPTVPPGVAAPATARGVAPGGGPGSWLGLAAGARNERRLVDHGPPPG